MIIFIGAVMTSQTDLTKILENFQKVRDNLIPTTNQPYKGLAMSMVTQQAEPVIEQPETEEFEEVVVPPVDFKYWETLAYELALDNADKATICSSYGISKEQLVNLLDNNYFQKLLQNKKDEIKSFGAEAAFTVKMRMIANEATPTLLRRLKDPNTNNKDFNALFKTAIELARLVPVEEQDDGVVMPVMGGPSIVLNINGVPGLDHLNKPVIDVE